MNQFTKDNLLVLLKCVRLCEVDHGECSDLDNVKFKLQKLIDNYCEHSNKQYFERVNLYECDNCHVVML